MTLYYIDGNPGSYNGRPVTTFHGGDCINVATGISFINNSGDFSYIDNRLDDTHYYAGCGPDCSGSGEAAENNPFFHYLGVSGQSFNGSASVLVAGGGSCITTSTVDGIYNSGVPNLRYRFDDINYYEGCGPDCTGV